MEKSKKKFKRKLATWLQKEHSVILSVIFAVLVLSIITLTVLAFLGYRFSVYENVRPDWEAIGTIFSFIASISAIAVAAGIPWLIAKKQNAIALFEKREEVYNYIYHFTRVWWSIGDGEDIDKNEFCGYILRYRIGREKYTVFCSEPKPSFDYYSIAIDLQEADTSYLTKIKHLFIIDDKYMPLLNSVIEKTEELYDDLIDYMYVTYNKNSHARIKKTLAELYTLLCNPWSSFLENLENQVTLSKVL